MERERESGVIGQVIVDTPNKRIFVSHSNATKQKRGQSTAMWGGFGFF